MILHKIIFVILSMSLCVTPLQAQQQTANQNTAPLEGRALDNVVAFTRLLGYVSHFYPGDVAAATNWEIFTYRFITEVENAPDAETLADVLNALFRPFAPTIEIYPTGTMPEPMALSDILLDDAVSIVQWVRPGTVNPASPRGDLLAPERLNIPFDADMEPPETYPYTLAAMSPQILDIPVNDPAQPLEVDLGAGVTARIPLAVYADETGTLPYIPTPQMGEGSPGTRATRLGVLALFWNHFQHLFSYWDVLESQGVDWEAALREALSRAALTDDPKAYLTILRHLMAVLKDGHITVYSPFVPAARLGEAMPRFHWDIIEGELTITTLTPDYDGQLQPGDVVSEIDGRPAQTLLAETDALNAGVGQFGVFLALDDLITGPLDSEIELVVQPFAGGDPFRTIEKRSERIPGDLAVAVKEMRPPVVAELSPGIVYLDVTRMSEPMLPAAIPLLAAADGLVVDYRGYTRGAHPITLLGHLADEMGQSPPFLLPVFTRPDHQGITYLDMTYNWVMPQQPRLTDNVAWIVNANNTVSYAEGVLGVVERGGFGEIVGTPTAGANGNVAFARFLGFEVRYTSLHVPKFDGSPLYTVGITPTIYVDRTRAGVARGQDELLEAAFRAVGGETLAIKPLEISE